MQDHYDHESKRASAGLTDPAESVDLDPLIDRLKEEYPGINGRDGWIAEKKVRQPATRTKSAGMEFEYRWDYRVGQQMGARGSDPLLRRPGAYFPRGEGEIPPVRPSPEGIDQVTILTARALCSIVAQFIYGTREPEHPEEETWVKDSDRALRRIVSLVLGGAPEEDPGPT